MSLCIRICNRWGVRSVRIPWNRYGRHSVREFYCKASPEEHCPAKEAEMKARFTAMEVSSK